MRNADLEMMIDIVQCHLNMLMHVIGSHFTKVNYKILAINLKENCNSIYADFHIFNSHSSLRQLLMKTHRNKIIVTEILGMIT